jgi:hypothetical protein
MTVLGELLPMAGSQFPAIQEPGLDYRPFKSQNIIYGRVPVASKLKLFSRRLSGGSKAQIDRKR